MEDCMPKVMTELSDPVTVQGRQGGRRSNLYVEVRRDGDEVVCRLGDYLDPGFWAEVTLKLSQLPKAINAFKPLTARDFRYADEALPRQYHQVKSSLE
jgi:hypothetical protein